SIHQLGGFRSVGRVESEREQVLADADALQEAGAFAVVLESIPAELAKRATADLKIPTIGIGAGPDCDGQVLVSYDALGLFDTFIPKFVKRYADIGATIVAATREYIAEVRDGRFPTEEHSVRPPAAPGAAKE
ncbi:MAG TPA: 3-methyl-2-oxobutanoate hydroxymethyltransferase, partial [Bryobacteraceae bacterium]|nr:3-methyl-2-oxobutanoate hydroxymethyltransferase [Bryobacteraceae bacterium]